MLHPIILLHLITLIIFGEMHKVSALKQQLEAHIFKVGGVETVLNYGWKNKTSIEMGTEVQGSHPTVRK
jgi:hypothetical protein